MPFPINAKLDRNVIDTCRKITGKDDIYLRQSYNRTPLALLRLASNRKTPKQKNIKTTRRIPTIGPVMVRELLRKMNDRQLKSYVDTLLNVSSILFHQKKDKQKSTK